MKGTRSRPLKPVVLVFGEDDNDRETMRVLAKALRPDVPRLEKRRKPLVLVKDRDEAARKKSAQDIAAQVARDKKRFDVRGLIAHEDCDAIEPAHVKLAKDIHANLDPLAITIIAATPAWETEAWLWLWPDAAIAHVPTWRRPARSMSHVGRIKDAKEAYRRDVRPKIGKARDYAESDAPLIAAQAVRLRLLSRPDARSDSYAAFAAELAAATF